MKPRHQNNAVLLSSAIYAPTHKEVRAELNKCGFCPSTAEIYDSPDPLKERCMVVPTSTAVYVVFRGTQNLAQWLSNATAGKTPLFPDADNNELCHRGFRAALQEVISAVLLNLEIWKHHRIVVCGHSRGAAMATLAAQVLDRAGFDLEEIHCFGTPRSLDVKGADLSDRLFKSKMWRWVANNDTDCRVPFRWMGFKHCGNEMYFDSSDKLHPNPPLWIKIRGQILGRKKGGWLDGLSDHNTYDEYVRLIAD